MSRSILHPPPAGQQASPAGIPSNLFREANWIGGQWSDAGGADFIAVHNPATDEKLGVVPVTGREGVRRAVSAARASLCAWSRTTARERSLLLKSMQALILENLEPLSRLLTLEQGKPLSEARGEIAYCASYFEWFAEEARRAYGQIIPTHRPGTRMMVWHEPVGVVATITPWNFPSAMLARKIAPALAAGCTVVSKPAELTPFSALALGALAEQAGLPPGVWNIITGDPTEIGRELCRNPDVRKLTFTGSTPTGKLLMWQCADTLKRLSFELGGNAPFIVFESADIDAAVRGAVASKYRNSGQTCVCVNRFLVQDTVYAEFAEKLTAATRQLRPGNGLEAGTDLGPLINDAAVTKVQRHIADARSRGAQIVCGGELDERGRTFFQPTVILDAHPDMALAKEETFGPVSALFRFKTEAEAVALANDTRAGLAAYFFSRDMSQIWRVAEQIEAGMIGVNEGIISSEVIPFGGVKESGFGREGGSSGIHDYLQTKYLCLGGLSS